MAEPAQREKAMGVLVLALCGESLLIEAIKASLEGREGVEVELLDTSQPTAIEALDQLSPDIIVFDLTPNQLRVVFFFLRTHADVMLIGLDLDHDQVLFLSGEWRTLSTVADLMQVIEAHIQARNDRRL